MNHTTTAPAQYDRDVLGRPRRVVDLHGPLTDENGHTLEHRFAYGRAVEVVRSGDRVARIARRGSGPFTVVTMFGRMQVRLVEHDTIAAARADAESRVTT